MKIFLHVGMPKCGSSALQEFLSSDFFHQKIEKNFLYISLRKDGTVLSGKEVVNAARKSPFNYCASHRASIITNMSLSHKLAIRDKLKKLGEKHKTILISCEGWGVRSELFSETDEIFSELNADIEVIAYVRPQVEWINSAWWQWGAWTKSHFQDWLEMQLKRPSWFTFLNSWNSKPWVSRTTARLLNGDIRQDFLHFIGSDVTLDKEQRTNNSLPAEALRFFQKYPALRKDAHASQIDFILSRHFKLNNTSTPWVLRQNDVSRILNDFKDENLRLIDKFLSHEHVALMKDDERWWSSEVYAEKQFSAPDFGEVKPDDVEQMLVEAFEVIMKLDKELRKRG